ncbi:MAG: N-acetyl-gamma-glutamyl-phosphate reductase [Novosphingobium sp. 63-713]|uniref:N-acetyl-gamma-glutamyl-phosphate reductase n=1 Tax=unclassified Novosphingobium TaxID=2644732 RepID=UPI00086F507B|nr:MULTISPECIES: N-acetyl-gamma-glutamyl-phosphate reductase [unclassified Novosphingobium]MBN9144972.1 N-acetyl-gamma-glutamyl-phosphate reductase [Novosphingobium sp.]MDR6708893.1 N-acetyl-gamma-glutamyl-phosphate reductase [Novosphingobium sp. 1748]ODU71052.1 MAG: N-acetyl-gamma-glutamyl-phosphate reductase [Novosphingobium sp. SCN 66-18]OJX90001.1 MAG: N-acetyl-gamma-glutamyl-phosphate reductase [Novosphingobium sp. 63-713]
MSLSVFIDGAAGTTGLEIADRLGGRSEFDLIILDDTRRKDSAARKEALHAADFAILCLHDDAAREAVEMAQGAKVRIIDASTAHRVTPGWTYGFPEIVGRDAVAGADRIANPGCYPTGFIALVAPLVRAGLLPADWPYTVNAVSGYSGGGKALIERFEEDRDIAFRAYGLGMGHKHVPEMTRYAGLAHAPVFAPSVIPAHRGMWVEVPLPLAAIPGAASADALREGLAAFYAGGSIVRVAEAGTPAEMLLRASMAPSDALTLHVFGSADGTQARLVAVLDNLGKGASGAAVQSLNLMAGLPETAGLAL